MQLGRYTEQHWDWTKEDVTGVLETPAQLIVDSDKALVRKHILEKMYVLYASPQEKVIKQYSRCITIMAKEHAKWPELKDEIKKAMSSQNEKGIETGLTALAAFLKRFQYE